MKCLSYKFHNCVQREVEGVTTFYLECLNNTDFSSSSYYYDQDAFHIRPVVSLKL